MDNGKKDGQDDLDHRHPFQAGDGEEPWSVDSPDVDHAVVACKVDPWLVAFLVDGVDTGILVDPLNVDHVHVASDGVALVASLDLVLVGTDYETVTHLHPLLLLPSPVLSSV